MESPAAGVLAHDLPPHLLVRRCARAALVAVSDRLADRHADVTREGTCDQSRLINVTGMVRPAPWMAVQGWPGKCRYLLHFTQGNEMRKQAGFTLIELMIVVAIVG